MIDLRLVPRLIATHVEHGGAQTTTASLKIAWRQRTTANLAAEKKASRSESDR